MLSQRSIGIRTFALLWQMVVVTLSFWVWLFIWQNELFAQPPLLQRYLIYNEFLLVGVILWAGKRQESNGRQHEWVLANRRSLRQALLGLFFVFLVIFMLRDTGVSRSFFLSFVPWFYLTLLFCNYFLPRVLARWAFSGDHEERVALVRSVEQATGIQPWLERKSLFGLRTIGLIALQPVTADNLPFRVLGTLENMQEILAKDSISQLIVLDLALGKDR